MPRVDTTRLLLSRLTTTLGPESARQELKWMKSELALREQVQLRDSVTGTKAKSPSMIQNIQTRTQTTLEGMVARRVAGEPLQYILGENPPSNLPNQTNPQTQTNLPIPIPIPVLNHTHAS